MTAIRVEVVGAEKLLAAFQRVNPTANPQPVGRALRRIALETQAKATNKIRRGGSLKPARGVLTSRTGTGRRSISTDFSSLPFTSKVGSTLGYMALHEGDGGAGTTVNVPSHAVKSHTRTVVFGRTVSPFSVPGYTVRAHSARYPRRPWLEPAVDEMVPDRASTIIVQEQEAAL